MIIYIYGIDELVLCDGYVTENKNLEIYKIRECPKVLSNRDFEDLCLNFVM
jgi:hypothetical protein